MSVELSSVRPQTADVLVAINDLLPENLAKAYWLKHGVGLSYMQIASELGKSHMTAYRWVKKAQSIIESHVPDLLCSI